MPVLTIQQILDSFEKDERFTGKPPEAFTKVLGGLAPEDELIRKQLPARLMRFDEDDTAAIAVISSLRKDRDNEVLLPEGMDKSNYNGVVLWGHDYWMNDIPHAKNLWLALDPPKGEPYRVVAKTQYLIELSELGDKVHRYRLAENPLDSSVGFRTVESVRRGQTGYEDVYKAWVKRAKDMLRTEGIKAAPGEFDQPSEIITEWELWEYSEVVVGSNTHTPQLGVKGGVLSPAEAIAFISSKLDAAHKGLFSVSELLSTYENMTDAEVFTKDSFMELVDCIQRVNDKVNATQVDIDMLKDAVKGTGVFAGLQPLVDLESMWDKLPASFGESRIVTEPVDLATMWDEV